MYYKTFTAVIAAISLYARVFATAILFYPCLLFAGYDGEWISLLDSPLFIRLPALMQKLN
jgi:hypothetical protein